MNNLRPLSKEILIEETHEGRGRIMEFAGFYYAEAKQGDAWQLVQFSEFQQVARMALDHVLADEFEGTAARQARRPAESEATPCRSQTDGSVQLLFAHWGEDN